MIPLRIPVSLPRFWGEDGALEDSILVKGR